MGAVETERREGECRSRVKVMEGRWGGEKRWGGRGGKELKIKGRACSSTCSISAIGTSSSGSLFCLSTYVMEMTFPELLKEVDIYAASDCRLEFKIVTEGGREDRRDRGGEIAGRRIKD